MNAKDILLTWKNQGGFKTYQELADFLGVSLATLDAWKNKDSIPEKYIHWHEKVSGQTQTQVSALEQIALELSKIPNKTPEQAVSHYKTILELLQR